MCIHITSFNHHVTVVIATCTYDYIYCICIYIYICSPVRWHGRWKWENVRMYYGSGSCYFCQFWWFERPRWLHFGFGHQKNTICIHVHLSEGESIYDYIYVCVFWGVESPHFCWYQKMMPHWQKSSVLGVGSISVATSSAAALPFSPCWNVSWLILVDWLRSSHIKHLISHS